MCITLTQNFSKVAENIAQLYRDDRKKNIFCTSADDCYLQLAICDLLSDSFYLKLATTCKNLFLSLVVVRLVIFMFYLKFITPKMWKLSWFSTFLLDYRGRTVCFFYVLEIFSAKPWFWIYFLSSRMTGFTTFCTSAKGPPP